MRSFKLAFFDFDDTLCVHPHNKGEHDDIRYLQRCIKGDWEYRDSMLPERMVTLTSEMSAEGTEMYCLTCGKHSLTRNIKGKFLDKWYNNIFKDVIVTSSPEMKITVMEAFADLYGIPKSEILFVDDWWYTVDLAEKAGFTVLSTAQVLAVPNIWSKLKEGAV